MDRKFIKFMAIAVLVFGLGVFGATAAGNGPDNSPGGETGEKPSEKKPVDEDAAEEDPLDELMPKDDAALAEEIADLISDLEKAPSAEAGDIQVKLIAFGKKALPQVKARLETNPSDRLYYVHSEIVRNLKPINGPDEPEPGTNPFNDDPDDPFMRPPKFKTEPVDKDIAKRYLLVKFEEAKALYREGNFGLAENAARAILAIEPETSIRPALALFIKRCRERILRESVAFSELKLSHYSSDWGDIVRITFTVRNVSGEEIVIPAKIDIPDEQKHLFPDYKGIDTSGYFTVKIKEYDELGQTATTSVGRRSFKIDKDIVLPYNATWTHTIDIPTGMPDYPNKKVLRLFKIDGTIIAQNPPTYKDVTMTRLMFPARIVRSFPVIFERNEDAPDDAPDEEKFTQKSFIEFIDGKPVDFLRERFDDPDCRAYSEVFLAAQLLKPSEYREGIDLLIKALGEQGVLMRTAVTSALKALTGKTFSASPEKWTYWWEKNREKFTSEMIERDF